MSKNLKNQQRILQMLSGELQDEIQDCQDLIYDYAEAQAEGNDAATLFPEVHAYLEDFGDEDEHYQAVLSLLEAEKYGRLHLLPPEYKFDAQRILPSSVSIPAPESLSVTKRPNGDIIAQIARGFLDALSNRPTSPKPAFVLGVKAELFKLEAAVDEDDRSTVTLEAARIDDNDDACSLMVQFVPDGVGWPNLGGTNVRLTNIETEQEIDEQVTDPFGKVKFEHIALDKLEEIAIEIES